MTDTKIIEEKSKKGVQLLEKIYDFTLNGVPTISEPISELIAPYCDNYTDKEVAIKKFIRNQKIKCSTTGFLTGLGGLITLPVTLPTDIASSLYMELRMIAGIALIRGYDIKQDEVKTLLYLCLAGNSCSKILKDAGIQVAEKIAIKKLIPMISTNVIKSINKAVGFRLITKFGSKGIVNFGKMIPLVGGVVGGVFNWAEVAFYARTAKKMFNENA